MIRPPPTSTLFPYTTLFRSDHEVPATVHNLANIQLATGLARNEVSIETVEHLLAALVSMNIDNVIVELNSDRKSTRLNSSHQIISYAVFCLKKKKNIHQTKVQSTYSFFSFFLNDTATPDIYTLSLHDALPI